METLSSGSPVPNDKEFIKTAIDKAKQALEQKYLKKNSRGEYDEGYPTYRMQYDYTNDNAKVTIPESIGYIKLLIDKCSIPLKERKELLVTLMEKNPELVKEKLSIVRKELGNSEIFNKEQFDRTELYGLLSSIDGAEKVDELFKEISGLDIEEVWREQKEFVLLKQIYKAATEYGENSSACPQGVWSQIIASVNEISSELMEHLEEEQKREMQKNVITEENIKPFMDSLANQLVEYVKLHPELRETLEDLAVYNVDIGEPEKITFEQQKILAEINKYFSENIKNTLQGYNRNMPNKDEYGLIIKGLPEVKVMQDLAQDIYTNNDQGTEKTTSMQTKFEDNVEINDGFLEGDNQPQRSTRSLVTSLDDPRNQLQEAVKIMQQDAGINNSGIAEQSNKATTSTKASLQLVNGSSVQSNDQNNKGSSASVDDKHTVGDVTSSNANLASTTGSRGLFNHEKEPYNVEEILEPQKQVADNRNPVLEQINQTSMSSISAVKESDLLESKAEGIIDLAAPYSNNAITEDSKSISQDSISSSTDSTQVIEQTEVMKKNDNTTIILEQTNEDVVAAPKNKKNAANKNLKHSLEENVAETLTSDSNTITEGNKKRDASQVNSSASSIQTVKVIEGKVSDISAQNGTTNGTPKAINNKTLEKKSTLFCSKHKGKVALGCAGLSIAGAVAAYMLAYPIVAIALAVSAAVILMVNNIVKTREKLEDPESDISVHSVSIDGKGLKKIA